MPRTRKVEFYKRMHCHNDDFVRCCMRGDYCGCCQNEQDGRFPCWEGKLWVFANFLERWLHYKVNNHTITKNKPIYHARNVNGWRSSVEPGPFISLLILNMINRLIFHHGIVIYIRIRVVLILVGWMDELGFYVPSTVFQSFRDYGRVNMKGSVQWNAV